MTGRSTTTSLSSLPDVEWERDVVREKATCPNCGRECIRLVIAKWGIAPIVCDACVEEWERAEGMSAVQTRAGAFAASGIPGWAAALPPDTARLDAFLHDMGAKGIRALWIERTSPDEATRDACSLLKAWMESKDSNGAYRSGAYVMETDVYSKDGIGAAATAGLLVIDGFGRRAPTRYEAGRLRELVEKRRIDRRPLVIATTLNPGRAGDVVGSVSGEGIAAMEAVIAMMRGQR